MLQTVSLHRQNHPWRLHVPLHTALFAESQASKKLVEARQVSFRTESAQTARAILFARATATNFGGFSAIIR